VSRAVGGVSVETLDSPLLEEVEQRKNSKSGGTDSRWKVTGKNLQGKRGEGEARSEKSLCHWSTALGKTLGNPATNGEVG